MAFAEELIKNRKKFNMTQEYLAEKCDVSRQAVAKWEKSESLPDVYTISKLAKLFNITVEELICSKELVDDKGPEVEELVAEEMQIQIKQINYMFDWIVNGKMPTKELIKMEFDGIRILVDYCEKLALEGTSAIERLE